jgi:hypothetical protein
MKKSFLSCKDCCQQPAPGPIMVTVQLRTFSECPLFSSLPVGKTDLSLKSEDSDQPYELYEDIFSEASVYSRLEYAVRAAGAALSVRLSEGTARAVFMWFFIHVEICLCSIGTFQQQTDKQDSLLHSHTRHPTLCNFTSRPL